MALAAAVAIGGAPDAEAALNRANKKGADIYAKKLESLNKNRSGGMSVDSLYSAGGGACGNGYELKVEKVLGSSCICVDEAVCGEGTEGERKDIPLYERAYGKKKD